MKINKKKKVIVSILSFIFLIFTLYTIVWVVNYKSYDRFIDESLTKLSYSPNSFVDRNSSVIYGVKKPAFLSFTGNLTCVSEDGVLTILIWPSFMSKKTDKIGLIITDNEKQTSYMVYVDKKMEYNAEANEVIGYTKEEEDEMRLLITKYKLELCNLYELAKAKFNL